MASAWTHNSPTSGEWYWARKRDSMDRSRLGNPEVVRVVIDDGCALSVERVGEEPDDGWEYKPEDFMWGPEVTPP